MSMWIMVSVVTRGNDPFEPGGEPFAVYVASSSAWDRMAEEVALDAFQTCDSPHRQGRTRDRIMADAASVYAVTETPYYGPLVVA